MASSQLFSRGWGVPFDDPIVVSLQEKPPTFLTPTFILCKMGMITATLQDC